MNNNIDRLFHDTAFQPDEIQVLCDAYARACKSLHDKGQPAIVSAVNSDISKKPAGGMHQFLSGEVTPILGTSSNSAELGTGRGGFWKLRRKGRTQKVPELERA